eukprot:1043347-Pyramimonas_sp.AAC.1
MAATMRWLFDDAGNTVQLRAQRQWTTDQCQQQTVPGPWLSPKCAAPRIRLMVRHVPRQGQAFGNCRER